MVALQLGSNGDLNLAKIQPYLGEALGTNGSAWRKENGEDGKPFCTWCHKLREMGACFCSVCLKKLLYDSRGKKVLTRHELISSPVTKLWSVSSNEYFTGHEGYSHYRAFSDWPCFRPKTKEALSKFNLLVTAALLTSAVHMHTAMHILL